jgi:predicted AAA+ superfamily ATPase
MWINRDFLSNFQVSECLEVILLRGPRQVGKTSMLLKLGPAANSKVFLDDPGQRDRARNDPEFFVSQLKTPVLIDEVQRSPELLLPIKSFVDQGRFQRMQSGHPTAPASFRFTGSNQTVLDQAMQESLAGRISIFHIHGLSAHEIWSHEPAATLSQILFRGGFPEIWINPNIDVVAFLNDYYSTFVERDVALLSGVEKTASFSTATRLLAARCGELLNHESLGRDASVKGKTIKDWISILEKNEIVYLLKPYHSNLNNRLIKMPKVYFFDTGLCARLQGHQEMSTILSTPQAGHLFENLVVAEVLKTKSNFRKSWEIHFWRTKEKNEIDLIVECGKNITLIQIKLGSPQFYGDIEVPKEISRTHKSIRRAFVCASGKRRSESNGVSTVPLQELQNFLLED